MANPKEKERDSSITEIVDSLFEGRTPPSCFVQTLPDEPRRLIEKVEKIIEEAGGYDLLPVKPKLGKLRKELSERWGIAKSENTLRRHFKGDCCCGKRRSQ